MTDERCLDGLFCPDHPRSWKVGVKTAGDINWAYNALRFATRGEAENYGMGLALRWTAVRNYEIHPSEEEPNR